jgi:hypothetical protein
MSIDIDLGKIFGTNAKAALEGGLCCNISCVKRIGKRLLGNNYPEETIGIVGTRREEQLVLGTVG